jgi:hypothetical protein
MHEQKLPLYHLRCVHYARFLRHALTSQIQKTQQKTATEQIKTATRSKLMIFKTRESQTKVLKMKNRKSECLNHLTALTVSNLKCHYNLFFAWVSSQPMRISGANVSRCYQHNL